MAHGLAAQLNGALRLASEAGVGTTAELWLPVTTVAAEDEKRRPPAQEREAAEKITVLVVDDDELVATSTVEMLKDLGHEVIEANSGDRALDILREPRPIDLLVTDYAMPRMNGAQLAAAARQIRPGLKVILATGYAELPAGGPVPHRIAKPYRQDEMAEAVRKVLSGASGERPC
jgi:CheY-like chemotaxis protein